MRFEGEPIVSDMEKKLAKGWDTEISLRFSLMNQVMFLFGGLRCTTQELVHGLHYRGAVFKGTSLCVTLPFLVSNSFGRQLRRTNQTVKSSLILHLVGSSEL